MRATYTGEPSIFPDLGRYEILSGDVVEIPEGLEDSFLQRPDFAKAAKGAKLTDLAQRVPTTDVFEGAPAEPDVEPEAPAPDPPAQQPGAPPVEEIT